MRTSVCILLLIGGLVCAHSDPGLNLPLTVKDTRGVILWTNATYFCQAGTSLVFKVDGQLEAYPVRKLDTNLLARLEIQPDEIDRQMARMEQKRVESMKSYAAYLQASQARAAQRLTQQMQMAQLRIEAQKTAQEEARKDLETQTRYHQSRASQLSAEAQVIEAQMPDMPQVLIQNYGWPGYYYTPAIPAVTPYYAPPAQVSPRSAGPSPVQTPPVAPGSPALSRPAKSAQGIPYRPSNLNNASTSGSVFRKSVVPPPPAPLNMTISPWLRAASTTSPR